MNRPENRGKQKVIKQKLNNDIPFQKQLQSRIKITTDQLRINKKCKYEHYYI
jgi:hypothetical protein